MIQAGAMWTDSINMTNVEDDIWNGPIPALTVGASARTDSPQAIRKFQSLSVE